MLAHINVFKTLFSRLNNEKILCNLEFRMSHKYADRKGFEKIAEWNLSILTIDKGVDTSKIAHLAGNINVVNASDGDFDKVAVFDRTVAANFDRLQWIEAWLNHQAGWSKVSRKFRDRQDWSSQDRDGIEKVNNALSMAN